MSITFNIVVGEQHFAVIINGEVRYCGVGFPYGYGFISSNPKPLSLALMDRERSILNPSGFTVKRPQNKYKARRAYVDETE